MKKLLLLLSISILLVNCTQDEAIPVNTVKEQHPNLISTQMANVVSNKFMKRFKGTDTRSANTQIKESFPIIKDSLPIMHVVNYEGGGFIIVAGDNRIEPLLAHSETGYFKEDEANYPEGLKLWINHINQTISYIRENDVELPSELEAYWNQYLSEEDIDSRYIKPVDTCQEIEDGLHDRTVGPLLSTKWNQGHPFNEQMPLVLDDEGNLVHAPVGCVPIAIAQIMKYHQYPTNYLWSSMPLNENECNQALWTLFNDIHSCIGAENITYKWNETTVPTNYNKGNLLKNNFGYSSAVQADYNFSTVKQEIFTYNRPVIISGKDNDTNRGHVWVCDGANQWWTCIRAEDEYEEDITFSYLQFHMNWGWYGNWDGWFSYGNFNPTGYQFTENLKMVYQIKP